MPGYACPFSLIGLTTGMTVDVRLKTGTTETGTLVAISRDALCADKNGQRFYVQFSAIDYIGWMS